MVDDRILWLSADELGRLYRSRDVSPVEAVDAALARIEQVDGVLNTMVTVTADTAREQAREAERRFAARDDLPPLYGVPITVKDLTDTAGVRTTYGCVAYRDHVPSEDALAWARLKAAGTILLGKTTTPEFGLLGVTESKLTGTTGTPWDPARAAGGSSGGAAAATVAGIGPLAWGSDGGGSIRVPASLCGAVGIKPSVGRIPHAGNTDPDTTEGPLTRRVVDAALLLDATVGPHPRDRFALPATGECYAEVARAEGDLTGVRVAASVDFGLGPVDPETRKVFTAALDDLRAAGAVVEETAIELPDPLEYFIDYWGPEYVMVADEMRAQGLEIWPLIEDIVARARSLPAARVSSALRETKTRIYEAYAGVFEHADVLVCPTTPVPAFPHVGDTGGPARVDGHDVPHPGINLHRMTESPSHAGLPAMSLPCGFTAEGLPVGLQIVAPLYADARMVSVAARYERATDWWKRHPEL
ncbi:aspartyl-tRNA(Asn)/glutamyl-tRNA(Gln) amidotransferase subunit A [Streptomyces sp. TLI_55]|uniref:amidase n=1 Tax=Streptomyces sp. TLI_55 TaxID=1938861 RepID=UPI000BD670B8|nr:amidase [Streptomyces sp. TLI_55]SNX88469.1 aspartyl-tRNA(Asn)/glutamyl-tRNA(Gln) amidotransferase subunit A [Streptomyces sp. TLI_55]